MVDNHFEVVILVLFLSPLYDQVCRLFLLKSSEAHTGPDMDHACLIPGMLDLTESLCTLYKTMDHAALNRIIAHNTQNNGPCLIPRTLDLT